MLDGQLVIHWVDNQGVLWNAAHGSSREPGCTALTHHTALRHAALRCRVWYEYVASAANVADLPSRGDFSYVHNLLAPIGGFWCSRRCIWFESVIPSFGW